MALFGPPAGTVVQVFSAPMAPKPIDQPLGGSAPTINLNEPHGDYGGIIPISMGTRRLPGQVIWAKPIYGSEASGYFADFAVAWGFNGDTDPSATHITKLWANGTKIWQAGTKIMPGTWAVTLYTGTETQTANATIVAAGGAQTGYRGVLYGVFTNFPITKMWDYGIPGISAEISGVVGEPIPPDDGGDGYYTVRVVCDEVTSGNANVFFTGVVSGTGDPETDGVYGDIGSPGSSGLVNGGANGVWNIFLTDIHTALPSVTSITIQVYVYAEFPSDGLFTATAALFNDFDPVSTQGPFVASVGTSPGGGGYGTLVGTFTYPIPGSGGGTGGGTGEDIPVPPITLKAFMERVAVYAGLDPSTDLSFDPTINDTIPGGVIGENTDFGEFEQNLGKFFSFDTFEAETIKFVRSNVNVIDDTLPATALLNQGDRAITTTRGEDASPVVLEGRYIDQTQQFRYNSQRARRILVPTPPTASRRHMRLSVPVVLTANAAITYLGKAIYKMAGQNVLHEFHVPPRYFGVEPGDVLAITAGDTDYIVKVERVEIGPDLAVLVHAVNLHSTEDIELEGDSGQPLPEYNGPT